MFVKFMPSHDDGRRALRHSNELDDKGGRLPSRHEFVGDKCHTRGNKLWDDGPQLVLSRGDDVGTRSHPQILNVQLALASAMQQLRHVRHSFVVGTVTSNSKEATVRSVPAKVGNQSIAHTNRGDEEHVARATWRGKRGNDVATLPEMSNSYFCGPINTSESPESSSLTSLNLTAQVALEPALCCQAGSASMKTDGSLELTGKPVMIASSIKSSSRAASD